MVASSHGNYTVLLCFVRCSVLLSDTDDIDGNIIITAQGSGQLRIYGNYSYRRIRKLKYWFKQAKLQLQIGSCVPFSFVAY